MHYHVVRIDEEGEHVDPALTFDRQDEAEERAVAVAREIDGPGRLRVEEEEPAAVEDQSTRLPPHPHGAQGAPCARLVSSDQGSTRRLTQRSATTKAAAVRIAIHASSAARPGVTVPRVSARHTFTAWVSGRSQANERAHAGRLSSGKKTPEKRNITEMPSVK